LFLFLFLFLFFFFTSFEGHAATVLGDYMYVLGGNDVNKTFGDFWRISLADLVRYVEKQWEMEEEDNIGINRNNGISSNNGARESAGNGNGNGNGNQSNGGSGCGGDGVGVCRDSGKESGENNNYDKSEGEGGNRFQSVPMPYKLPAWECLSANCSLIGEKKEIRDA
jgi:Kelch motif